MKKIKTNELYNDIAECKIADLPSILLTLAGMIDDLEFRLSQTDEMPYPPRNDDGLLYDFDHNGLYVIDGKIENYDDVTAADFDENGTLIEKEE